MGVELSDPNNAPELSPDDAITQLDEGLQTCRSVVADYRAALIANGTRSDSESPDNATPAASE